MIYDLGIFMLKLIELDTRSFMWVNQFHKNQLLMKVSRALSFSGDGYFYVVLGLAIIYFEAKNAEQYMYTGLIACFIEIPSFIGLKLLFKRNRPFQQLSTAKRAIQPSDKFSLPSGHSAAAFLIASLICLFYPAYAYLAILWACGIGASRVVLGVHYPSDILAGALLGLTCTGTAWLINTLYIAPHLI